MVALHRLEPLADGFEFLITAPWGMALDELQGTRPPAARPRVRALG